MSISEEIERLERLRANGTLTDAEFQEAKSRVLSGAGHTAVVDPNRVFGVDISTWCMLMHLSQLLNFAAGAGIVAPIVMWVLSKEDHPQANRQGIAILNWLLTFAIFAILFGFLSIFMIGIPFLVIVVLLSWIFPIVGAIKAINGEFWEYPLTIRFLKYPDEIHADQPY